MSRKLFLSALFFLLLGCRNPGPQVSLPTPTPPREATATVAPSPVATLPAPPSRDPILAACPAEQQRLPFRDDMEIDLETLGLDSCYDLTLELDESGESFEARAKVTLRNGSEDPWPTLLFRLYPASPLLFGGNIEIEYVTVSGIAVEGTRRLADQTALEVPLSNPIAPGKTVSVEIAYRAQLADLTQNSEGVYGIFARAEHSVTLASWFPLLAVWDEVADSWYEVPVLGQGDAVFSDSALIQATLSAPERYRLAASGLIVDEQSAEGRTRYRVVTGPSRDLTLVWVEGYEVEEAEVDGTLLRHWYRTGDEAGAEIAFVAAREALPLYNETFGPYPFEELDLVEIPLNGAGGVEYPQLYLLDEFLYEDSNNHEFLAFASAHEMAHQWWYYVVGNDVNAAPWQDEALTNWSAVFWLEQARGADVASSYVRSYEQAVDNFESQQGEEAVGEPLDAFRERDAAYGTIVYLKGTLFFEALRERIGDDAFFAALRAYYADHRFQIARPAQLLDAFETASGETLDDLYAEWGVAE